MQTGAAIKRMVSARERVGLTASVLQRNALFFHTFVTDHHALILLRRGKKTLIIGGKRIVLHPGDGVAIAAGTICDVQNETERGQFESTWVVCSTQIIAEIEKAFPSYNRLKSAVALKGFGSEFVQSFERSVLAISAPDLIPEAVATNRVRELLIWLLQADFVFDSDEPAELQRRVRLMIGAAPEKNWISKHIAQSLAMSEVTFRRKLADKGESFSRILVDVRMSVALTFLQATDVPIAEIAYRVGYESASRFSVRFKKRFGFSPTAVRGITLTHQG